MLKMNHWQYVMQLVGTVAHQQDLLNCCAGGIIAQFLHTN